MAAGRWGRSRWTKGASIGVGATAILVVALLLAPSLAGTSAGPLASGRPTARVIYNAPKTCTAGSWPTDPAYDPVNHDLYVPNQNSANVSVLSPACTKVGSVTLPTGSDAFMAAFDPQDNYVYVTDSALAQVYVIKGTSLLATLGGGWFNHPRGIAFDPGDGIMLVGNWGSANLTAVLGTNPVGGGIPVGSDPMSVAYDPFYDELLVADEGSNNITIITNAVYPFTSSHLSVSVPRGPESIIFDPADEYDYVACYSANRILVIDGNGNVYGNISTPSSPRALGFSQARLAVYAAILTGIVWILQGTAVVSKVTIGSTVNLLGMGYDDYLDRMIVGATSPNVLYEVA